MKYFFLFLSLLMMVAIVILYFQLFVGTVIQVPFFTEWINVRFFALYLVLLAFFSGICITISIKGFMSGTNDIDDEFNV